MALKVLVVDDASFVRDMVKRTLRNRFPQLQVDDAVNGRRAQVLMNKTHFDLILCDWEMPEMSGVELLEWARQHDAYKTIPFVMVTSRGDRDHVVKAVQAGVSDYLTKPFSADALTQKVTKALGRKLKTAPQAAARNPFAGSAEVLTGGAPPRNQTPGPFADSAQLLTGGRKAEDAKPARPVKSQMLAQLRSASLALPAVVKAIALTDVKLVVRTGKGFPGILEPAVVDLEIEEGKVERLNGYIHALQALERTADSPFVSIIVRFVDEDPQKLESLSRLIARL